MGNDAISNPVKKILVATDFSERSRDAEAFATNLAAALDASLIAVHAIEPIPGAEDDNNGGDSVREFYDRLLAHARGEKETRLTRWNDAGILAKYYVEVGRRWEVVLEQAELEDADLIVVGRRSHHTREHLSLGTTSQKLYFGSRRPVLMVPHGPIED